MIIRQNADRYIAVQTTKVLAVQVYISADVIVRMFLPTIEIECTLEYESGRNIALSLVAALEGRATWPKELNVLSFSVSKEE